MKRRTKIIIGLMTVCAASLTFAAACASWDTPYDGYDKDEYKASVRYDVNGGQFASKDNTNIVDVFSTEAALNGIKLAEPGSDERGSSKNLSIASRSGYFLAGWYREKTPRVDSLNRALDDDGNLCEVTNKPQGYVYGGKWDFENDLFTVTEAQTTSKEPSLTLHAGWVPNFTYTFYSQTKQNEWEQVNVTAINPLTQQSMLEIDLPYWEDEQPDVEDKTKCSASMIYGNFPQIDNKTFKAVYSDKDKQQKIEGSIKHNGYIDEATGTAVNGNVTYYLDLLDGLWFHIYTPKQFVDNARTDGSYEIYTDITFDEEIIRWSAGLAVGEYTGTINGNGHTFSNITVTQSNTSQMRGGIFGSLGATAVLRDITFKDVTYTLGTASRMAGSTFGLFAGTINEDAVFENVKVNGVLHLGPDMASTYNYYVGLLCSNIGAIIDELDGITYDIDCVLDARTTTGTNVWPHKATVDEYGAVTITFNEDNKVDPNPVIKK